MEGTEELLLYLGHRDVPPFHSHVFRFPEINLRDIFYFETQKQTNFKSALRVNRQADTGSCWLPLVNKVGCTKVVRHYSLYYTLYRYIIAHGTVY